MTPDPLAGADAVTPENALNGGPDVLRGPGVLSEAALGFAPLITDDDAVADPGVLPGDALPVVVPEDARAQLGRLGLSGTTIDDVVRAAERFTATVGDGRSVDPLTLGLLWLSEGGAQLTITLDPFLPDGFGPTWNANVTLLVALHAEPSDLRRTWRITMIGLWGFGLDDIFTLPDTAVVADLALGTSLDRWARRLDEHGDWTQPVPFATTIGTTSPVDVTALGVVDVSFTHNEAVGFLITVAARFTKQLWALPGELAARGVVLSTGRVEDIPIVEPVLAYLCYLTRAPRAAGTWEALIFLREFCAEVVLSAPTSSGTGYDLAFVIAALNRWLGPLRDDSRLGLPAMLRATVRDETARVPGGPLGRDLLDAVALRTDWDPIPDEAGLDAAGRALLEGLVDAWSVFARRCEVDLHGLPPGELFFQGADRAVSPQLFTSHLGTTGFGARNYGRRFQAATGAPLGAPCTRTSVP